MYQVKILEIQNFLRCGNTARWNSERAHIQPLYSSANEYSQRFDWNKAPRTLYCCKYSCTYWSPSGKMTDGKHRNGCHKKTATDPVAVANRISSFYKRKQLSLRDVEWIGTYLRAMPRWSIGLNASGRWNGNFTTTRKETMMRMIMSWVVQNSSS